MLFSWDDKEFQPKLHVPVLFDLWNLQLRERYTMVGTLHDVGGLLVAIPFVNYIRPEDKIWQVRSWQPLPDKVKKD